VLFNFANPAHSSFAFKLTQKQIQEHKQQHAEDKNISFPKLRFDQILRAFKPHQKRRQRLAAQGTTKRLGANLLSTKRTLDQSWNRRACGIRRIISSGQNVCGSAKMPAILAPHPPTNQQYIRRIAFGTIHENIFSLNTNSTHAKQIFGSISF
jgi:hypothetical protein